MCNGRREEIGSKRQTTKQRAERRDTAKQAKQKECRCTKVNNKCIIKRLEPGTEERRKRIHVGVARLRIPGSWKVANGSERGRDDL